MGTRKSIARNVCREVDRLRCGFGNAFAGGLSPRSRRILRERLASFGAHPMVAAFLVDVDRGDNEILDVGESREVALADSNDLIVSIFDALYHPQYGLEAVVYERVPVDPLIATLFPCDNPMGVILFDWTAGFDSQTAVAIFPENFATNMPVRPDHRVLYFLERFAHRFACMGAPILDQYVRRDCFAAVRGADTSDFLEACSVWVHLHEHFHRCGPLPLPTFLAEKSKRSSAALEELRVDLRTVLACFELAASGMERFRLWGEFVLAYRLLLYPVQISPARGIRRPRLPDTFWVSNCKRRPD